MHSLSHKVALVTGASRGIGRSIAVRLAQSGARVVINYASNEEQALQTAQLIKDVGGPEPLLKAFDVSNSAAVTEAIAQIESDFGSIDVLVNNAGIVKDGLLLRYRDEDWHRVLDTNLGGAFYCARVCARQMMKKRWGRIINISSIVGECGNAGQVAYVSAKAGLIGMTKSLAKELASRNITVNAVTPGYVDTEMTAALKPEQREALEREIPLGFVGAPSDIAHSVAFLASDEARYITGHVLAVNGGMYI
jgi:3-oxoacyl-[acyl-carrier protein] reductase